MASLSAGCEPYGSFWSQLLQVGHGRGPGREVIELALLAGGGVVVDQVHEELFGGVGVRREVGNHGDEDGVPVRQRGVFAAGPTSGERKKMSAPTSGCSFCAVR